MTALLKPIRYAPGSKFVLADDQLKEWRELTIAVHMGNATQEQLALVAHVAFVPLLDHITALTHGDEDQEDTEA